MKRICCLFLVVLFSACGGGGGGGKANLDGVWRFESNRYLDECRLGIPREVYSECLIQAEGDSISGRCGNTPIVGERVKKNGFILINVTPVKNGKVTAFWEVENIKDDISDKAVFGLELKANNGNSCISGYGGIAFKTSKRFSSDLVLEGDDLSSFIPDSIN